MGCKNCFGYPLSDTDYAMLMKQISGMVHGRLLQPYGMPMVGFGMVATYLTLPTTGDTSQKL